MGILQDIEQLIYGLFGYQKVTLTSTLTTSGGSSLSGQPIAASYELSSASGWKTVGTQKTSASGVATVVVFLKPQVYSFRCSFAGAPGYEASEETRTGFSV